MSESQSGNEPPHPGNAQSALLEVLRTIASGDSSGAQRLLATSPELATLVVEGGATRQDPTSFYFERLAQYAYAGDTALHIAAAAYDGMTVKTLISMGARVRARNRRGAEPLHCAAEGHPGSATWNPRAQRELLVQLIQAGADPNAEDNSGVAPLHRAVRTRCSEAVEALLANGAEVLRKNGSGSTPLHLAVQNTGRGGSGSSAAQEEQARIIRLLLQHGARPTDKDWAGKSVEACVRAGWIHALFRQAGDWQRSDPSLL